VSVTIYHNQACGTSRNALAIIRQSGEQPEVIEYLQHPPSRGQAAHRSDHVSKVSRGQTVRSCHAW